MYIYLGPPGVGRNELKRRLLASNPSHFKATVPREYPYNMYVILYYINMLYYVML